MVTPVLTVINACHNVEARKQEPGRDSEKERVTMPKETTHRDPEKRAARIERRAKKRVETVMRTKLVKMMKSNASILQFDEADALFGRRTDIKGP